MTSRVAKPRREKAKEGFPEGRTHKHQHPGGGKPKKNTNIKARVKNRPGHTLLEESADSNSRGRRGGDGAR